MSLLLTSLETFAVKGISVVLGQKMHFSYSYSFESKVFLGIVLVLVE